MKSPIEGRTLLTLTVTTSTQDDAAEALATDPGIGAVMALEQTAGRGRFQREWHSPSSDSLSLSIIFHDFPDHPKPWLLGMACACATAAAIHGQIQWPNDVILGDKKVAGILTEVLVGKDGKRYAVVGIGVNLNQTEFPPEIADRATSLALHRPGSTHDPKRVANLIFEHLSLLPEPMAWDDLRSVWMMFDATPTKKYTLANGDQAVGVGIGPEGELICAVDGETQSVMAADAIFGPSAAG